MAARVWQFLRRYTDDKTRPGISMERVQRARTAGLWSARVNDDVRAIVYRDGADDYLLYVDRHDRAYAWASNRRVERNGRTGALQIFSAPEVSAPPLAEPPRRGPLVQPLFAAHSPDYLLSLGLPGDWLPWVREVRAVDDLLAAVDELPADVGGRLLDLAEGKIVSPPAPQALELAVAAVAESTDGSISPDLDDLERLLAAPLSTWIAFLHPSQRYLVNASFSGPAKVTGSAGTGKSVVAMHRARQLSRQGRRVLVMSYVTTLCDNIGHNLGLLCTSEELSRIDVRTVHQVASSLAGNRYQRVLGDAEIGGLLERFCRGRELPLGTAAMLAEWNFVIQAHGIDDRDSYRTVNRAGRGTPLSGAQRDAVWEVMSRLQEHLRAGELTDWQGLCRSARELVTDAGARRRWDSVIVDEVQDLSPQALRLAGVLGGNGTDGLMVVGDGGQRIFAHRTSLRSAGIEVRGRSRVLRVNYRTTEQIRRFADKLLAAGDDLEGNDELRDGCRSIRGGAAPEVVSFDDPSEQYQYVAAAIADRIAAGVAPPEIAVFARTKRLLMAAAGALSDAGISAVLLEPAKPGPKAGGVQLVTMHRAKGLEFKIGAVIDASSDAIPNAYAIKQAGDERDRDAALELERQLLYVSLTRARDEVLLTWAGDPSPFLADALASSTAEA